MTKTLVIMVALAAVAHGQFGRTLFPVTTGPYVAGVPLSATETMDFVPAPDAPAAMTAKHVEESFFRDSAGRTREEIRVEGRSTSFYVVDPVANTFASWVEGSSRLRLSKLAPRQRAPADSHPEFLKGVAQRPIEGFAALRMKSARVLGMAPTDRVVEAWYAPELRLDVLTVLDVPGAGRVTYAFHDLVRGEPDAALFVPPADLKQVVTTAPQVVYAPEPEFSEAARKAKVNGNVLVYLEVDESGKPVNVRVLRGIGMGLDEKAVEAVKKYRFKPATEDGKPIKVEMNVEVNFQIFTRP